MHVNSLKVLFTSLQGRYARALFLEGKKGSCLEEILENFSQLETFFKNNPSIKKLLTGHSVSQKDLDLGWIALGQHLSFCPIFLNFIRQLVINKRFNIINKIKYVYGVAFAKHKNSRNVIISSAVELLPEQKKKIENLVLKVFEEKVIIRYKINEKILAGIKIASEEMVVDASAFAQIKQLASFYKNIRVEGSIE